jgi:metal-responsive CopG/Arc/MetJ family transcriptional regulator
MIDALDEVAETEGTSRSEIIRRLIQVGLKLKGGKR